MVERPDERNGEELEVFDSLPTVEPEKTDSGQFERTMRKKCCQIIPRILDFQRRVRKFI
jgi:hypothetical protein